MSLKSNALSFLAQQHVGITADSLAIVNRFRQAVDGKASGEPWCVCFVQHMVREVDALFTAMGFTASDRHKLPATESTQALWAMSTTKSAAALIGSIAVWRLQSDPTRGHCGIVIANAFGQIVTVEGNTTEPGATGDERNGRGIWTKKRGSGDIPGFERLGYVVPWP